MNNQMSLVAIVVLALAASAIGETPAAVPAGGTTGVSPAEDSRKLSTDSFIITIDDKGCVTGMLDKAGNKEILPKGRTCPLLSIKIGDKTLAPVGAKWSGDTLELSYAGGERAKIAATQKPSHIKFELLSAAPKDQIDEVTWGPFYTVHDENAGTFTGILWDKEFTLGLQTLNPKTMVTVNEQGGKWMSAHSRDYERPRKASAFNHEFTICYPGEGVAGSKFALLGCPSARALDTIAAVELAEGLPHMTRNGKWFRTMPGVRYLSFEFGEDTIDDFIKVALASGIKAVQHPAPWETWGHLEPKKTQFPHGREGFKACVDKVHKAGLEFFLGTLNFVSADDPYVTPKPDPRLATAGSSKLAKDITDKDTVIEVADGAAFGNPKDKRCLRIGDELIMFGNTVGDKPARLEGCSRGAFGTKAAAHRTGDDTSRMILGDFFGPLFYGNRELVHELARIGAEATVRYDLQRFGYDGLEGATSSGLETEFAMNEAVETWHAALGPKQNKMRSSASGMSVYTCHFFDSVEWGEPWGAEFRKGMLDYRFMRMEQYRRNMIPKSLGQYCAQMYAIAGNGSPELNRCRVEDIEWLMGIACGNDAGFQLSFTPDWNAFLRGRPKSPIEALMLPNIDELTGAMHAWQSAYDANAFPQEVKTLIGERNSEFHLVENGPASWTLYPLHVAAGKLEAATRTIKTDNPNENAPVHFVIFNAGSPVSKLALKLPGNVTVPLEGAELKGEEIIRYTGGEEAVIYGRNWNKLRAVKVDAKLLKLAKGPAEIAVDWAGDDKVKLTTEIRLVGPARQLTPQK